MLDAAYPGKVIPVKFSAQKKSEIGWKFLAILKTGRLKDHAHTEQVRKQYAYAKSEIMPGPAKLMRWGCLMARATLPPVSSSTTITSWPTASPPNLISCSGVYPPRL